MDTTLEMAVPRWGGGAQASISLLGPRRDLDPGSLTFFPVRPLWWCIKLWDITSLGSVQVVGFFDVAAAHLCAGDGPIGALVGRSSCSIGSALQHRALNDYKNNITVGPIDF